jgi:hypothetical protein
MVGGEAVMVAISTTEMESVAEGQRSIREATEPKDGRSWV